MNFDYNRLKAERIANGFTVEEMANSLNISKGAYSKKENGKSVISVDEFVIIISKLKIKKDMLNIFFTVEVAC